MIIKRIFNNNILLAEDEYMHEVVLLGKGIAFQKKMGDEVEEDKIQKRFIFDSTHLHDKFNEMLNETPIQFLDLTNQIVELAQQKLQVAFNENVYITLTDHIAYAISRYKEGQLMKNALLWDIKKFYKREFQVALLALDLIAHEELVELSEDEAGFIAMHFVNAQQSNEEMEQTVITTKIIEDILRIVESHYHIKIDEDSLNYTRFVSHIRYFIRRVQMNDILEDGDTFLFEQIKRKYPQSYACACKVEHYLADVYQMHMNKEEISYFMLHIHRVTQRITQL